MIQLTIDGREVQALEESGVEVLTTFPKELVTVR